MPKIDESRPFIAVRIAVLTVSDTRSLADDRSGDALVQMLEGAGHKLAARALVTDDVPAIGAKVQGWIADPAIDVVITTGGTGFTGRDVTPEAVRPLFEKEIDGFSTVFHMISFQKVGTSTVQSRACAGLAQGTYIFCLPGSPGACKDAWNEILKWQLDNRHRPCNFVEIMPRLEEHRPAQS
jgi:molybdopterin adenylyltransferase